MNLFAEIKVNIINNIFKIKKPWHTKTGWRQLKENETVSVENVLNQIDQYVRKLEFYKETSSKEIWIPRKVTIISKDKFSLILKAWNFTQKADEVKKARKVKLEDTIERLFTASDEENKLFNQYAILSGTMELEQRRKALDMIIIKDGLISEMIELKEKNTSDNPLFAAFELYFDFILYKELIERGVYSINSEQKYPINLTKNLMLTVLAPGSYYDYYQRPYLLNSIKEAFNEHFKPMHFNFMCYNNSILEIKNIKKYIKDVCDLKKCLSPEEKKEIRETFSSRQFFKLSSAQTGHDLSSCWEAFSS